MPKNRIRKENNNNELYNFYLLSLRNEQLGQVDVSLTHQTKYVWTPYSRLNYRDGQLSTS